MGNSTSKSSATVTSIVNAGISVIKTTVSNTAVGVTNINEVNIDCPNMVIEDLTMKNYVSIDINSVVKALSSSELKQDIEKAMQAQAQSLAVGGLGFTSSKAESIVSSVTNLSTAITEAISNSSDTIVGNINRLNICVKLLKRAEIGNVVEVVIKQITESDSVTKAEQKLKEQLEALGVSKAKGLDPTAMFALGMVAIVLVTAFLLFGGIGFVAKTMLSSAFWMLACGVLSGFLTYSLTSTFIGLWPSKKLLKTPTEETAEQLAARKAANDEIIANNMLIRKSSAVILPIAVVGTALFGWMTLKTQK